MKRNIAIVAGGDTSEIVVSLRSAQGIYSFIDKEKYNLYIVEMEGRRWEVQLPDGSKTPVDRNDFSFMNGAEKVVFDFAYITIHGTPGEDGRLQGYFDMMRIPYSCCGVLAAAITYDKFVCNQYLKAFGVRISESLLLRQGQAVSDEDVVEKIGLPCFIKPNLGGSSFGVTKVKTREQIQPAIAKAFSEAEEVMIEAFMDGTELTCGCYKTKEKSVVFPLTEVVTHNEFFDYDAKYNGQVDEITPARISEELTRRVQTLTSAIYDILGCSGIIRVDYIITEGEKINLLEVNTTPGMTATSFIPQQVRAAGDIAERRTQPVGVGLHNRAVVRAAAVVEPGVHDVDPAVEPHPVGVIAPLRLLTYVLGQAVEDGVKRLAPRILLADIEMPRLLQIADGLVRGLEQEGDAVVDPRQHHAAGHLHVLPRAAAKAHRNQYRADILRQTAKLLENMLPHLLRVAVIDAVEVDHWKRRPHRPLRRFDIVLQRTAGQNNRFLIHKRTSHSDSRARRAAVPTDAPHSSNCVSTFC